MRTVPMCFSILQVPRCRTHTLANFWWESFQRLNSTGGNNSSFRLLGSKANGLEGGCSKRWTRRALSTKTGGRSHTTKNSKSNTIGHEVLDETASTWSTFNVKKTEASEFNTIQYCDIRQKIAENKDLANSVTIIVFDMETTGFSRETERIIEVAFQDIKGGKNSTFQTLVNPGRHVANSYVHHITTHMVCRSDVPRCCGFEIPPNWSFVDTLPLARELIKLEGSKLTSGTSLEALCKRYSIQLAGKAHRAMADVSSLSLVLQRLTFDLKLPLSGLIARHFTPADLTSVKKKK